MLTFVEYTLLLYRAFLASPVWYRFFLNKEYEFIFTYRVSKIYGIQDNHTNGDKDHDDEEFDSEIKMMNVNTTLLGHPVCDYTFYLSLQKCLS